MKQNEVVWGLLGAGDVCEQKSGPPLYQLANSRLHVVHRRNRQAGEDFVQRHGHGRYVASEQEVYHDPEVNAVYVATPPELHAMQTMSALRAGKNVLVEKPMALNRKECEEMIALAREKGCSLAVAYYRRAYPSIRYVKTLLATKAFGELRSLKINNEFPTNHRLDLVHFLVGRIASLRLVGGNGNGYDFNARSTAIELRSESSVSVRMGANWLHTDMPETLALEGSKGVVYLSDLKVGRLTVRIEDGIEQTVMVPSLQYTHWGLVENFVLHITEDCPLVCSGLDGWESTVLLDLLSSAEPNGTWTSVQY